MPVLLRQPVRAMAGVGHEDAFPRPRLSARCRFGQGNFTGTRGNGRDAPKADLLGREPRRSRKRPGQNGWLSQHLLPGVNTPGDDLTGSGSVEHDSAEKRQRVTSPTASASDGNGKRRIVDTNISAASASIGRSRFCGSSFPVQCRKTAGGSFAGCFKMLGRKR
jgi:hypothetical protein